MKSSSFFRVLILLPALLLLGACSADKISFPYPDEELDFRLANMRTPSVYIENITDMRPPEQRLGQGKFMGIVFPKDEAWERPVTEIYAEALAKDVEQTNLVQIVPLRGQADYVLSADIISLGCRFERSAGSFLIPAAVGAAAGLALGEDGSDRAKLGAALAVVGVVAIPMPSHNRAEADIRLTLKDRTGDIMWQKACLGEYEDRVYAAATSRQDQRYVTEHLTRAVKRANACLLGQMRQFLLESAEFEEEAGSEAGGH